MRKAISYARFSSAIQGIGSSESRQADDFRAFCRAHDLEPQGDGFIDRGKSGFKGAHVEGGAFGEFLKQARTGKFASCVLVVEALDRATRQEPLVAGGMLLSISKMGIDIGVCNRGKIYTAEDLKDMSCVLTIMIDLCAAYDYSLKLQKRLLVANSVKRTTGKGKNKDGSLRGKCPCWLEVKDGKYQFNDFADMMRRACLMSIAGHGQKTIRESLGLSPKTNLNGMFKERTLIGEYQPMKRDGKTRVKVGQPFLDFYPALLSLVEFTALQDAIKGRRRNVVARSEKCTNLFTMLFDAVDKSRLLVRPQRKNVLLLSKLQDSTLGKDKRWIDYASLEKHLLDMLYQDLTPEDLNPIGAKIESEIDKVKAKIYDNKFKLLQFAEGLRKSFSELVLSLISELEDEQKKLAVELDSLVSKQAHNPREELTMAQDMASHLAGLDADELLDARIRLKSLLTGLISSVEVARGKDATDLEYVVKLRSSVILVGGGIRRRGRDVLLWERQEK